MQRPSATATPYDSRAAYVDCVIHERRRFKAALAKLPTDRELGVLSEGQIAKALADAQLLMSKTCPDPYCECAKELEREKSDAQR